MNRLTLLLLLALGLFSFVILCSADVQAALRVNVMPSGTLHPYAWPGRVLTIWGNVQGGTPPYQYTWDFGDGTAPVSGIVADAKYIAVTHSYATMGPKIASLTVTDNVAASDNDQVRILVVPEDEPLIRPKSNAAIENGLRYLYLTQAADGSWPGPGNCRVASTGLAVLAFENNGHRPVAGNIDDDIYVECAQKGLQYVLNHGHTEAIAPQSAGNPDVDADGKGICFYSDAGSGYRTYETGIVMMTMVGIGSPETGAPDSVVSSTSSADINGHTCAQVLRDVVDWCAWAQEENSVWRGGWRYTPNYSMSDNSVSQWPAIGLEAAETQWGISAPAFVKSELMFWINYSQNANGCFGYTNPNDWLNVAKTGAGLCLIAYADIPVSDPRPVNALGCICANWNSTAWDYGNFGDLYAMYAVAKGCRISVPNPINLICGHKWADEYDDWLFDHQLADGSWSPSLSPRLETFMATELGVLILTPGLYQLPPVAMINAPDEVPPDTPFPMDARKSIHMDPSKRIVEWLWDFDNSDGVDWNHPDVVGVDVMNPGYSLSGGVLSASFTVTLRVADNSDSVMTDTDEHVITVNVENHRPIADAGGPYSARINQIITFDGTGSFDLDPGDYIASYSWDLNGDGIFGDCTDSVCTNSWDHIYSGQVGLIVTDSHGAVSDTGKGYVTVWTSLFDAWLTADEIRFSPECPGSGQLVTIAAAIHCDAASDPIDALRVRFYDGNPDSVEKQIGADQVIAHLDAGNSTTVQVVWSLPDTLMHEIYVRIDPDQEIEEFNEDNNEAHKTLGCPYINACIDIDPNTLNLKSKGQWITCYIEFCDPTGYDVANIDVSSVKLNGVVPAEPRPTGIGDYDSDGIADLMVKFDRSAVQGVVAVPRRHVEMTVTGSVGALEFRGTDYIDVINPPVLPGEETPSVDVVSLDTYPNPFNPSVRIEYGVPSPARVLVQIWSVGGRLIRTVEDAERSMGMYAAEWNGKDEAGRDVSSGLYFCRLTVGKEVLTKKLMLLK
jgi:hypothetical protein